jgi:hypothetical protein
MYHLMMNLPVFGTLGVVALLAGPLARLPIDLGAWLLELGVRSLERRMRGRAGGRNRDRTVPVAEVTAAAVSTGRGLDPK